MNAETRSGSAVFTKGKTGKKKKEKGALAGISSGIRPCRVQKKRMSLKISDVSGIKREAAVGGSGKRSPGESDVGKVTRISKERSRLKKLLGIT